MQLELEPPAWLPIEPLSDDDKNVDLADITSLYAAWHAAKMRFTKDRPKELAEFNQKLVRRLSVETGILERLYDLDIGTTEALVLHGFREELISRSSTDISPARLIDILRDHEAAIKIVMDWVGNSRPLTKGGILELHATLVRHQETTPAIDQFGNRVELKLLKGKFKENPNNPKRSDGAVHFYCPPVQVDSEIERLLKWHGEYTTENVDPVLHAAWLHHRFTQIHPFQDGNGRVVRSLTTYVLLRAGLLPLVVDRDKRPKYIDSLEKADQGNLDELTHFIAGLERSSIVQALSVESTSFEGTQSGITASVVETLRHRLESRRIQQSATLRKVNDIAKLLRGKTRDQLQVSFESLRDAFKGFENLPVVYPQLGGTDFDSAHWYKYEIVQTAREAGKFINFSEEHYFVKVTLRRATEKLDFVVSLHHVGRELSGVMEATAFAKLEPLNDSVKGEPNDSTESHLGHQKFFVCSSEPFVFSNGSTVEKILGKYMQWLDESIAVAMKEFIDQF